MDRLDRRSRRAGPRGRRRDRRGGARRGARAGRPVRRRQGPLRQRGRRRLPPCRSRRWCARCSTRCPRSLVPAFSVSVEVAARGSTASRAYEYVIAADDGRILQRANRTFSEARTYRVWADGPEAGYRPTDGPQGDLTPHPTGDVNTPVEVVGADNRIAAEVEGLNVNADGVADAWLPDGAADLSLGNNVSAYADHAEPDGLSEGDALATQNGSGAFAYGYNLAADPTVGGAQIRTAISQLFFTTNWLHDWWYGSGFTEAAGNAQLGNYGRGGEEADVMLAEAQDTRGTERNNANMSTPPDGLSPRMQMYIFDGPITPIGETTFEITSPPDLAGEYTVQGSFFGVDDLVTASGALVLVDDGVSDPKTGGTPNDGCEAFDGVTGAIAVVTRGALRLRAEGPERRGRRRGRRAHRQQRPRGSGRAAAAGRGGPQHRHPGGRHLVRRRTGDPRGPGRGAGRGRREPRGPRPRHRSRRHRRQRGRGPRVGPLPPPPPHAVPDGAVRRDERGLGRLRGPAHDGARAGRPARRLRRGRVGHRQPVLRHPPRSLLGRDGPQRPHLRARLRRGGAAVRRPPDAGLRRQQRGPQRGRDLGHHAVRGLRGPGGGRAGPGLRRRPAPHGRLHRRRHAAGAAQPDLHRAARRHPGRHRRHRRPARPADRGAGLRAPRRRHRRGVAGRWTRSTSSRWTRASRSRATWSSSAPRWLSTRTATRTATWTRASADTWSSRSPTADRSRCPAPP